MRRMQAWRRAAVTRRARRRVLWLLGLVVLAGAGAGAGAVVYLVVFGRPALSVAEVWMAYRGLFAFLALTGTVVFAVLGGVIWWLFRQLERAATVDPLTGAWNRHRLASDMQMLQREYQRYDTPYCVLLLDFDHFKQINDTYGHAVGDEILIGLVLRLRARLRAPDVLYRYGGEEFVVLAPQTDPASGAELGERLRQAVAGSPFKTADGPVSATISIGVAGAHPAAQDVLAVLDAADDAMYRAKQSGRNCVCMDAAPADVEGV